MVVCASKQAHALTQRLEGMVPYVRTPVLWLKGRDTGDEQQGQEETLAFGRTLQRKHRIVWTCSAALP